MQPQRSRLAIGCALVFVLAFGVRLLYWQDASVEIARGDSTFQALGVLYRNEARRMLDKGGVLFPTEAVDPSDARLIVHPPGYAILMAAARTVGHEESDSLVRLLQIICAAFQALLVVLIAAELLPLAVALTSGLLVALSPHLAYYSVFLSPDSLAVLPILLAVYLLILASKRPLLITIVCAGIAVGLSCWLRSNALLLAPFLALAVPLLFKPGKRLGFSVALVAAAAAVIAPITIRNGVLYHRFIPISIGAGLNLLEGIGEYDRQGRFGLPVLDNDVMRSEAETGSRPDYGGSLYFPDGIDRDRGRMARAVAVIRAHPGWFAGVALRRAAFMLRYNDYRFENPSFNDPHAPAVSAGPQFGHDLEQPEGLTAAWSNSAAELIAGNTFIGPQAAVSLDETKRLIEIAGGPAETGDLFVSAPVAVKKQTDYLLELDVEFAEGPLTMKVRTADPRITLAASAVPRVRGQKKSKQKTATSDQQDSKAVASARTVRLCFASGNIPEVRMAIEAKLSGERALVRLSRAGVVELGPTPNQWTRYPRAVIRGLQKNLFKTEVMLPLVVIGIGLLVIARRREAVAALLAVPIYYLTVQSLLHTEYRYILAMHYFLFVFAGVTLYYAWIAVRETVKRAA